MAADLARRRVGVAGLGDHLPARGRLEQHPDPGAHDRVVVGEDDPKPWRAGLRPMRHDAGAAVTVAGKSSSSGRSTPRGVTMTGHVACRITLPLTPPSSTARTGP